ncbi:hypothetical protein HPB50_027167 [Hyalomma asiaticum]|uniref:Uncharacterized protein n=1 Tax=Hyalomma asiaticum TaxID=266040 RepID=A0ACB7RR78_HYAAI|nr:hypothetical protein HPB50_027167 [Hyalomma asiaticum]
MVLPSTRPEYNHKVDLVIAYGPVANVSRVRPPLALLLPFVPQIRVLLFPVSSNGYLTTTGGPSKLLTALCKLLNGGVCSAAAVLGTAISVEQLNSMYKAKDFVMYDYGADENQKRYSQREPPAYPLERITTPVAQFSSEGDTIANPRDVEYLAARLGETLLMQLHRAAEDIPTQRLRGFLFADAGFDVWSMNSREASRYSNHTTLSKDDPEYWKFSFDEIGRYDIAAVVDHVLNVTGARRLTLLGLSQGVPTLLVFLSTRPEYNDKVDLVVAYGPVANVSHLEPPFSLVLPLTPLIAVSAPMRPQAGYLEASEGLSEFLAKMCVIFTGDVCSLSITLTLSSSPYQLNETRTPVYIGHYPIGTTIQNFKHYHQMYKARDFVMYNHGSKENRKRYGQARPPAYPLERITTPWAVFSSEGDVVADPRDVEDLVARLGPSVLLHRVVPQKTFRHVDFSIGYRAKEFLHDVAIDVIKTYTDHSRT